MAQTLALNQKTIAFQKPMIKLSDLPVKANEVVWYVVAIALLVLIAVNLTLAAMIWCLYKHKNFFAWWRIWGSGLSGFAKIGCM